MFVCVCCVCVCVCVCVWSAHCYYDRDRRNWRTVLNTINRIYIRTNVISN